MSEDVQKQPQPWPKLRSESGPDLLLFRARYDTVRNPRTSQEHRAVVLEAPTWCIVAALTEERRLIVIRQFRFGNNAINLEIPGGTVEPGEDSLAAAQRELMEETGFTSLDWTYLGSTEPNPAFLDNVCHHWLAENAHLTHEPRQGRGEAIAVHTLRLEEVQEAVSSGEISASLVIATLAKILDLRSIELS